MSKALFNRDIYTNKVEAYVAIDVTGLTVAPVRQIYPQDSYPRDYLSWLNPGTSPLLVAGRIVDSGTVTYAF
jgi:hypothetical protein